MRLLACFIALALIYCNPGFAAEQSALDAAIDRGLGWVFAHPATCQDGGFLDLVDEGLFYLTIERLSADEKFDARHERAFKSCISRLEASPELERRLKKPNNTLIGHYHLLLATHLIKTVRNETVSHDSVIKDAQRTLANNRYENPTFRLTVALLIQHLGATPQVSMDELLDASLINRIAKRGASPSSGQPHRSLPLRHPLVYYALVHEVAALTDFGRLPVSPWLMARRSQVSRILQQGSRQAMLSAHVDLLAEILLCNHMLGLPVSGELRAAIDFLVASQRADGSWGEQLTPRANRTRHAVQTATLALLAYKTAMLED